MSISYDFEISVYQEKFHFRILNEKYFKTLETHCINRYSLETIFFKTGKKFSMTGNYFCRWKRSPCDSWPQKGNFLFKNYYSTLLAFQIRKTRFAYCLFQRLLGMSWYLQIRKFYLLHSIIYNFLKLNSTLRLHL